jgi:cyclopropane-fatty-acyl-phospholipid synthase
MTAGRFGGRSLTDTHALKNEVYLAGIAVQHRVASAFIWPSEALGLRRACLTCAVSGRRLTSPLRRQLHRLLPSRPFEIRFWDGSVLPATATDAPVFELRAPAAIAHLLRAPGRLGLGRAYVQGSLDAPNLDEAFRVFDSFELPPISPVDRLRLLASAIPIAAAAGMPRRPVLELVLGGERHSLERDAAAVRYHYDAGNEFFALFLDSSMTYSCALFSGGAQTLEEAQEAKLELVAKKLRLRPGTRVLDVGCGWGSFAIHAARKYGATVLGVTLSEPQAELARMRVAEAGVAERVEIRVADYRQISERRFDAISSIGMVEHVGASRIDEYARALASLLVPGGLLLNHGIAALRTDEDAAGDAFTNRYVFPDGEPLHLSRIQLALERAGLLSENVEGFVADYSLTLAHWARRLDENLEAAERLAGPERTRVWRLYLRAARVGFETGFTAVYQVIARRTQ